MKYRTLGSSGLIVSRITLGTMTFGAPDWGCDEKTSHAVLRKYIDMGGNHLDSADIYAGGKAEEIIGSFMPQMQRDEIVIASKCYFPAGKLHSRQGLSRKHIFASCEGSLKRLKSDYIDLYYLHGPDPLTSLEETMDAMDDLVRQGKVRYLGCSNLYAWQIAKAQGIAHRMNLAKLIAGQYIYSLIHRELEREVIPAAVDHGVGMVCFSPLGGGLLTGKYKGMAQPAEGTRLAFRTQVDGPRFWHPKGLKTAELIDRIAGESGISRTTLAIAWLLKRKFVSSVIIGVKSLPQLEADMEPADWDMPEDVWNALEEETRPDEDYLTWFNKRNYERIFATAEFHDEMKEHP
jgi:aryl-alcohol dehydrogenase-like predicted oxidoreductase